MSNTKENEQLTSVKVQSDLFEAFKVECIRRKYTINKLVNRAMDLFVTNDEFRSMMMNHTSITFKKEDQNG